MILLFVVLAVLWNCSFVVDVRKTIGGMVAYFQADRIYWTFPFLWMLVLVWIAEGLLAWLEYTKECIWKQKDRRWVLAAKSMVAYCLIAVILAAEWLLALQDNVLNKNVRLVLFEDYKQITWENFYMEDVFDEIDLAIGEDKADKSVVSLGMYPAIALYNGYSCADGYSNNYSLDYKRRFRKIISKELEKNPEARVYFDDWGNRAYMLAQPFGNNAMVAKGQGISYQMPEYDVEAMREMNIGYIFSAAEIEFEEEDAENYTYLGTFSNDESYFEIWIYKIL